MDIIDINASNIDSEHVCCALGNDKDNKRMAATKKAWLKDRFSEGLVFRRLDERGKVFIEFIPIEKAWKPLDGSNCMVIDCLWVSGRFKGQGYSTRLLDECVVEARRRKMDGVVAVSSSKARPFLTEKSFFERHGFVSVDTAPPYFELMFLSLRGGSPSPRFTERAKAGTCPKEEGLVFAYSNQCPFMEDYVALFAKVARGMGMTASVVKLESAAQAREWGSPFGTLGIFFNGKIATHELMPESRMGKFLAALS
jgi:N-acetylglutamate synthase and related acetyltransferases